MAIVKLGPLFKDVHGKIGDLVFRRGPNGQTIVSRAPRQSRPKSQKAQKVMEARNEQKKKLMQAAHEYAHTAMTDPEMKASYEQKAKKQKKSAYHLALSDYLQRQTKLGE